MTKLILKLSKRFKLMAKYTFAVILILCIMKCTPSENNTDNVRNVIGRSNFIFSGTIVKMNSSNIDVMIEGPSAIVMVNEVIDAVSPYDQMKGKEITVLLASDKNREAGDKEVFYTMGWYYGKTLGVKEIPNNLKEIIKTGYRERIAQERLNIQNDSLRAELKRAKLVVQGIVIETSLKDERYPPFETEHDPAFRKAVIEIKEVIKGDLTEKRIDVYYSSSDDVMWSNSPKLMKDQEGIFLLQVNQAPPLFKMKGYTTLDKRDVQPNENLTRIQELLK